MFSTTITFTDKTKFADLYSILSGTADASITVAYKYDGTSAAHPKLPGVDCQELLVQADPATAGYVLVGDKYLAAANVGAKLAAGDSLTRRAQSNSIALVGVFLGVDTDGGILNVLLEYL